MSVTAPVDADVLTVGASAAYPTRIGFPRRPWANSNALEVAVTGKALSFATLIQVETRFFDASGAVVLTSVDDLHAGQQGQFSASIIRTQVPAATTEWAVRLVVTDGPAVLSGFSATPECFGCNPSDPNEPGTGDGGDTSEPTCADCSRDCDGYTATGEDCGKGCSATCDGVFGDSLVPDGNVTLDP
jgi:hypothetical protein